jgi:Spy/CpxP family protein refolding chaperone
MRKSIIMGLGLALSLAAAAAAQQPDQPKPRRERGGEIRGPGMRDGRGPAGLLLKDITLTEAQKTQLQTLRKTERDEMVAKREQGKKQHEEVRAARQRGDTAAARAIVQRQRQAMEQERAQQIAAIRNILTADQRVQFDKNIAELKQRQAQRAERFGQRGPRARKGVGR